MSKPTVEFSVRSMMLHPTLQEVPEEDYFELWTDGLAHRTTPWWKNLPVLPTGNWNRALKISSNIKRGIQGESNFGVDLTIKSCPPIKEFMARTLVVKAPCDMDFAKVKYEDLPEDVLKDMTEAQKTIAQGINGTWYQKAADDRFHGHNSHGNAQYYSTSENIWKGWTNLKIESNITLHLPEGVECQFNHPTYHWPDAPFIHLQGVFTRPLSHCVNLIWNVMLPDYVDEFRITEGDALFYVTFNQQVNNKFKYTNANDRSLIKTKMFKPSTVIKPHLEKKKTR